MAEHLLNTKEAALYLGMDEKTLREAVRKKIIPAYKIGGTYLRFKKVQLDTIKSRLREPSREPRSYTTTEANPDFFEDIKEFIYFNDFYIISVILIAVAVFVIFTA